MTGTNFSTGNGRGRGYYYYLISIGDEQYEDGVVAGAELPFSAQVVREFL